MNRGLRSLLILGGFFLLCVFVSCSEQKPEQTENYQLGYQAGYAAAEYALRNEYDNGFFDGHEEGYAEGWDAALDELVANGVLRITRRVYLDPSDKMLYHSFYCDNKDYVEYEDSVLVEDAVAMGYAPCPSCNGDGFTVYTTP